MLIPPPTTSETSLPVLVVGFGSIGKLHAEVFQNLGCKVGVVTSQKIEAFPSYSSLEEALCAKKWHGVVIANPTNLHGQSLHILHQQSYAGCVLVEKPILSTVESIPEQLADRISVGYNLRFNPLLERLRQDLNGQAIVSVLSYVGQYLPTWRPNRDYRESYSAKRSEGGGVLRDLSHELDFLSWLFGSPRQLVAWGGHFSALEMDVEDTVSILMETPQTPKVTVELNYLDRPASRFILVNGHDHTWKLDFIQGRLTRDGEEIAAGTFPRHTTYERQAKAWLSGDRSMIASCSEGLAVIGLIEKIEQSLAHRQWMSI